MNGWTSRPAHRTACLLVLDGRRYLSGIGVAFPRQVQTVETGFDRSLLVLTDGAGWIRTFFRDHLAMLPRTEMLLGWYHLVRKCRDLGGAALSGSCPAGSRAAAPWVGNVPRTVRVLEARRWQAVDPQAVDDLSAYLRARAE